MGNAVVSESANVEKPTTMQSPSDPRQLQVQCRDCGRTLMPPASSPSLFRCPCGSIVRNAQNIARNVSAQHQNHIQRNVSAQHQNHIQRNVSAQHQNHMQCTSCYNWLIPPPGAPRFRCSCGNILINTRLSSTESASPQSANRQPSISPNHHSSLSSPSLSSASQNNGRHSHSSVVHARCPRCTQTLVAPPGHSRFRCPCGQMLALSQSRLRCPQCSLVLLPPPGARQFRCPCGVVLRTPATQVHISARTAADSAAPQARAVTRDQLDLSNLDDLLVGKEGRRKSNSGEGDGNGIQRFTSIRERLLQRRDKEWERSYDRSTLQSLWKLSSKNESKDNDVALLDPTEQKAWVRSLRLDGTLAWREAGIIDPQAEYVGAGRPKEFAKPPHASVHDAVIEASKLPFGAKLAWFRGQTGRMKVAWGDGHQTVRVKRDNLLETSTHAIMKINPNSFHQIFRFEFVGEPAKDAGGVAREWYDQLTKTLFNPDFGLFQKGSDFASYLINPSSGVFNDHHLLYFRFAGRLMGKALFDGQLVDAHLTRPIYKHLLGHPLLLADLEFVDPELYKNLRSLPSLDEDDIEDLCQTFSVDRSEFGTIVEVELKPGGTVIDLTKENVVEYTQLRTKYHLFSCMQEQLQFFLQGFYEVVPHYLVSVFDSQELEVLLSGLDRVDMDDWKKHTEFRGETNELHKDHQLVQWFFEICEEMDENERAKLLQWCTGSARVPIEGFVALQSHDGKLCRFALKAVALKTKDDFPIAHTCFNRIDLPKYETKEQMQVKLIYIAKAEISGFEIE